MEVVSIVGNRKLDAVVVGIGLEMLDGCSITTYLKKERKVPYPVIVWSRDIGEPLERYLNECGADLVIDEKKPEAASRLRAYLQKKFA
jgi:DNA-binding response OmpR family regulator